VARPRARGPQLPPVLGDEPHGPDLSDTLSGINPPQPPGILAMPPRERVASLGAGLVPAIQSGVAAGVAWYIAHDVVGHTAPFFAPIAALIVLAAAATSRMRRVAELALGVAVGIGVGDVLVAQIGTGAWQVMLVVVIAMSAAILLGGGPTFIGEAATSGVLVATVAGGAHGQRFVDAVVGGLVGLGAVVALPQSPLRLARRQAAPVFSELAAVLADVADALDRDDVPAARQALARTRRTEPAVVAWRTSLAAGSETVRLSPLHWRSRTQLDEYQAAAFQLELAVRNARVLARAAVRAAEVGPEGRPELAAAVRKLGEAVQLVEPALEQRDRSAAIEAALRAATLGALALERDPELASAHIVGQVRSISVDLLRALGVDRDVAVEHVRRAAGGR